MTGCCLSDKGLYPVAEAITGFPATLGFLTPEAMSGNLRQTPVTRLDLHKSDVYAVGVMCLLFLSPDMEMPFGPTKKEMVEMQRDPAVVSAIKQSVVTNHNAWVSHAESLLNLSNCRDGNVVGVATHTLS